jgi:rfaE bifunctional protein kinase chain/domain
VRCGVDNNRKREILNKFPNTKILVIGDVMVDHFIHGNVTRISPEAPVPVVTVTNERYHLGGSANVMNNINSVGGKALMSCVIGNDETGKWLVDQIRRITNSSNGIVVDTRPTTLKSRVMAHSQQVVRFDRELKDPISEEIEDKIVKYAESVINNIKAIIISDYAKGVITEGLLHKIKRLAYDKQIPICVDPKRPDFDIYRNVEMITPNTQEAERAVGFEIVTGDDAVRAANLIMNRYNISSVLLTRGDKGMLLVEREKRYIHIPASAREVYDVTGAGDTAIAIFTLCVASGATFAEAAFLANKASGVVVGKIGTSIVTKEELL